MTWKDKMVLCVLVEQRTHLKVLMDNENNDYRYSNFEGAYDALCFAIALLRCPLRILIQTYNQFVGDSSKSK